MQLSVFNCLYGVHLTTPEYTYLTIDSASGLILPLTHSLHQKGPWLILPFFFFFIIIIISFSYFLTRSPFFHFYSAFHPDSIPILLCSSPSLSPYSCAVVTATPLTNPHRIKPPTFQPRL